MGERYRITTAVMLFLFRNRNNSIEILLQKRQNTGYADGMWDCAASGHVEANESMKTALVREAKEELNIDIDIKNVEFATLIHKCTPKTKDSYNNTFFAVTLYKGVPIINEPEKCSDLQWFNINNLPDDLLQDRKKALDNYFSKIPYDELDWDNLS